MRGPTNRLPPPERDPEAGPDRRKEARPTDPPPPAHQQREPRPPNEHRRHESREEERHSRRLLRIHTARPQRAGDRQPEHELERVGKRHRRPAHEETTSTRPAVLHPDRPLLTAQPAPDT